MDIKKLVTDQFDRMVADRRYFHEHAESSEMEVDTAAYISDALTKEGIEHIVTDYHAVIATIHGAKPGRTIALRGDIDALPMAEDTDLPFACKSGTSMHACGHDAHAAMLLTAARTVNQIKDQFDGTVKFLFQPAEETCTGARKIVKDGFLNDVDMVFGEHVGINMTVGQVDIEPGVRHAASRTFYIDLSSDATEESLTVPAAFAAILDLQMLSSRETDPAQMFVFSICDVHGGLNAQTGKDTLHLEGTCRTYNLEFNENVESWTRRIFENTCAAYGVKAEVRSDCITLPVVNDEKAAALVKSSLIKLFGPQADHPLPPTTGSEDFAEYLSVVPGAFANIGANNEKNDYPYPNHHQKFDIDERTLIIGASLHVQTAYDFLTQE